MRAQGPVTTIPNPDDWKDVFTILAAVAIMSVPSWFAIKAHRTSEQILAQTKNGHPEPMRADLDRVIETTDRALETAEATRQELGAHRKETRQEFAALREDLGDERNARRDGDAAIREAIDRDRRRAAG